MSVVSQQFALNISPPKPLGGLSPNFTEMIRGGGGGGGGGPLSKLFKERHSMQNSGLPRQPKGKTLKNLVKKLQRALRNAELRILGCKLLPGRHEFYNM